MNKKRILIISTGAGGGHLSAAKALEQSFLKKDKNIEVKNIDVLNYTNFIFKKVYAQSYLAMVNHLPAFWGYFYRQFDKNKHVQKVAEIRKLLSAVNGVRLFNLIKKFNPDYILHTHFLSVEIVGQRKKFAQIEEGVVITDYDMHTFWLHKHINHYFVASREVKWALEHKGINASVWVTGIPVREQFRKKQNKQLLRKSLGLDSKSKIILILGGGFGVGVIADAVKAIISLSFSIPVELVVIAGKNKALKNKIEKIEFPLSIKKHVLGFVENIHEYMMASDIGVGKAGGLTVSETLAVNLPLIIMAPIPGQEERNTDFLLEHGASLTADNIYSLEYKIMNLVNNPNYLNSLKSNIKKIARPKASDDIVARILAD